MTTPISLQTARALGAHLAERHGATVVEPSDTISLGMRSLLTVLARVSPVIQSVVDELEVRARSVSVTIPTPAGVVIVLSEVAVADPTRYAVTVCHEIQHAKQLEDSGYVQGAVDYVASPELRARAEADAYSVGLYVAHLLSGITPSDEAVRSLSGDLYHLAPDEVELARGVIASHVETIRGGVCPPLSIALEARDWLQEHAPECLV